jgi:crossover junction endodeoxyribonuclease RusA
MIHLKLPYPPSFNAYWMASGHRRYISKRGVAFKIAVQDYVIENNIPKLGSADIEMSVILHPRSKKLMDLDNCLKAICDSCQDAGIFDNDVQLSSILVTRGEQIKGGGCQVFIRPRNTDGH